MSQNVAEISASNVVEDPIGHDWRSDRTTSLCETPQMNAAGNLAAPIIIDIATMAIHNHRRVAG